jgi:hypothetical protein
MHKELAKIKEGELRFDGLSMYLQKNAEYDYRTNMITGLVALLDAVTEELDKRGIKVLCTGSDGDIKFLISQKKLLEFGKFSQVGPLKLAGNINSSYMASQDSPHIAKKIRNAFMDPTKVLILGEFHVTRDHLVMLMRRFNKSEHHLVPSGLDYTNKMNYDPIPKMIDPKVISLLEKVENSQGTIALLQLIKFIWESFVSPSTIIQKRLYGAVYSVYFLRIWRQHHV